MAKSVRGAADRFHTARMFRPHHRVECKIVAPDSEKLFCLLPALPNPFGVGQGRSGVESRGEARKRAHRRDSSTCRTPSPIPTPRRLVLVNRSSATIASVILMNQSTLVAS